MFSFENIYICHWEVLFALLHFFSKAMFIHRRIKEFYTWKCPQAEL